MRKYVKIVNYMHGDSIREQLEEIKDNGLLDKDLAIFFGKTNTLSMREIAYLMNYFKPITDDDFATDNVIFIPLEWVLVNYNSDKDAFKFGKQY